MGLSDPFVEIFTDPKTKARTKKKSKTLDPVWDGEKDHAIHFVMIQVRPLLARSPLTLAGLHLPYALLRLRAVVLRQVRHCCNVLQCRQGFAAGLTSTRVGDRSRSKLVVYASGACRSR